MNPSAVSNLSYCVFFQLLLQFLKSSTQATWGALFRHETLSKEAVVVEMAVKYLRASMTNLVKVRQWESLPFPVYIEAKLDVNSTFVFLSRLGFHLEMITQVVSTPGWTLTATRTSTHSLIVSIMDSALLDSRSVFFILSLDVCLSWCIFINSFPSAAGRGGEDCMSHRSSGGFPDSSRMVAVSDCQTYWHRGYHM